MDNLVRSVLTNSGVSTSPTYVDDVFSSYAYDGTGTIQRINAGIDIGSNWHLTQPTVQSFTNGLLLMPFDTGSTPSEKLSATYSNLPTITNYDEKIFGDRYGITMADPGSNGFRYGTGSLSTGTIEYWAYPYGNYVYPLCAINAINPNGAYAGLALSGSSVMYGSTSGTNWEVMGSMSIPMIKRRWNHFAISWSGGTYRVFVNGALSGTITGSTYLGSYVLPLHYANTGIPIAYSNLLISSTQKYTTGFTVPNGPWNYTGIPSIATLTTGSGGLVWIKGRSGGSGTQDNALFDTARGTNNFLRTNLTNGENTSYTDTLTSFSNGGFEVGADATTSSVNGSGTRYISWLFRKAPKFFDIVTYTGDGSTNRQIPHSLGVSPGCIIIKNRGNTFPQSWPVWHRYNTTALGQLNTSGAFNTGYDGVVFQSSGMSATTFGVANNYQSNASGENYVAYLFAHNAGGFGLNGTDNIISCNSFTTDASGNAVINLGYEPQWILIKSTTTGTGTCQWYLSDSMRTIQGNSQGPFLSPNSSANEVTSLLFGISSTGFKITGANVSETYVYVTIRRPNKPPISGTTVYKNIFRSGTGVTESLYVGMNTDVVLTKSTSNATNGHILTDRLRSKYSALETSNTNAEDTNGYGINGGFDLSNGIRLSNIDPTGGWGNASGVNYINHFFRRAPGFFDIVHYFGNSNVQYATQTINHNLGSKPELIIIKAVSNGASGMWIVGSAFTSTTTNLGYLYSTSSIGTYSGYGAVFGAEPTTTTFSVINQFNANYPNNTNENNVRYMAYLFASLSGISKIGTYTGNGTTQTINCNFTTGARFIIIKRIDGTGDWYVWDSANGIVSTNEYHLSLNSTATIVADDTVDPDNTGFIINQIASTNVNVNAATYLYLAIA